jgi:hypothetical protein
LARAKWENILLAASYCRSLKITAQLMAATQEEFYREDAKPAKKDGESSDVIPLRDKRLFRTLSGQPTVTAAPAAVVCEQAMPDGTNIATIIIFFFQTDGRPSQSIYK